MKSSKSNVSLSEIATKSGFSIATVSMALRGNPRISQATRELILGTANALGYHPDPLLGKLMTHLRARKPQGFQSTLCALRFPSDDTQYTHRILERASIHAAELGYKLVCEAFPSCDAERAAHEKSLYQRGIEGLLLLPPDLPMSIPGAYNWPRYSVVATGYSPHCPEFDRIGTDWFYTARLCIKKLSMQGYRRIGFIVGAHYDVLMRQMPSAALAEECINRKTDAIRPYFYLPDIRNIDQQFLTKPFQEIMQSRCFLPSRGAPISVLPRGVLEWFEKEKPDILVFDRIETVPLVMPILQASLRPTVRYAVASRPWVSDTPGVCQRAEVVADKAVDLLHQKLLKGEKGIPPIPLNNMSRVSGSPAVCNTLKPPFQSRACSESQFSTRLRTGARLAKAKMVEAGLAQRIRSQQRRGTPARRFSTE